MRLLIAAGGTGGHLFPGISVARAFKEANPGGDVLFVGSERGLEREILEREGFRQVALNVGRLKGEGWTQRLKTLLSLPGALLQARSILKGFRPDLVFGIGGYSSGPMILAARSRGIPRAVLEPNAIPGYTNRKLAKSVDRIFIAFPKAKEFFPESKVRLTGTPVRAELTEIGRAEIPPGPPSSKGGEFTVLVLGGSQGATAINKAMTAALPKLEASGKALKIIHQTGTKDEAWVKEAYAKSKIPHEVSAFIADMARVYREADLAVSRAGASTCSEILATRTPSILVPYPFAADDHQRFNAASLAESGGAEVIANDELAAKAADRILHYESNRAELADMKRKIGEAQKTPATEAVLRELLKLNVSND
ncbi:MAG TPA: undecaprenyldiphospho-muramoylpentapeptide beta-N-acetylglucosaminyltransferase [bacterium]|nr:undecaprenyldiphospho-muramoylpentapeptide beta-N-acetylglucosaminyltransferase [bacterium]